MKKLFIVTTLVLSGFSFGQDLNFPMPGDGSVDHLIPTKDQMKKLQCNENGYKTYEISGDYTIVTCTDFGNPNLSFTYGTKTRNTGGGGSTTPPTPLTPMPNEPTPVN